jgi:hypothetical protein
MAIILNDNELKRLIGTVIIDGDTSSIRPNSYVLRLGDEGEFLNATKEFTLGKAKKGIRVLSGFTETGGRFADASRAILCVGSIVDSSSGDSLVAPF